MSSYAFSGEKARICSWKAVLWIPWSAAPIVTTPTARWR